MNTQSIQSESENKHIPMREVIQKRAYDLFVKRGRQPGHELEDWLQAEREVTAGRARQGIRS